MEYFVRLFSLSPLFLIHCHTIATTNYLLKKITNILISVLPSPKITITKNHPQLPVMFAYLVRSDDSSFGVYSLHLRPGPSFVCLGSRDSRGSRDSASIEVLSAPTSPVEHCGANSSQHIIGRNPLRGSKCKANRRCGLRCSSVYTKVLYFSFGLVGCFDSRFVLWRFSFFFRSTLEFRWIFVLFLFCLSCSVILLHHLVVIMPFWSRPFCRTMLWV